MLYSCSNMRLCCSTNCWWAGLRSLSRSAYLRVLRVWSLEVLPGQMQASMMILTLSLARNESLKTMVNLLCRKGTCCPCVAWPFWASMARTHSLRPRRDLLISAPSCYLSFELSMQSEARSLPAKSTSKSLPHFFTPSSWILIWQTAWLRLEVSFDLVACVVRTAFP